MFNGIQKSASKILVVASLLILLSGCKSTFTKTPVVSPTGTTNFVVSVSPQTSNTLEQIRNGINAVPDVAPPVTAGKDIALGLLSLTTLVLGAIAKIKTNSSNAHQNAADLLAAQVVSANQQNDALKVASGTPYLSTVAQHIDNNTIK